MKNICRKQRPEKKGRNAPCPCGSTKKYKNCCLSTQPSSNSRVLSSENSTSEKLELGLELQIADRLEEAQIQYESVLKLDPNNSDALHLMGMIARKKDNLDLAIKLIKHAITIKPIAAMHNNLGLCLQDLDNLPDAIDSYKKSITMYPEYTDAYINLGKALQAQGNIQTAINYYQKALLINENSGTAHLNLGTALQIVGDSALALRHYFSAAKVDPNNPIIFNNIGHISATQGSFNSAIESFNLALKLRPDFVDAYSNLGSAYSCQGKHKQAITCFEKALLLDPSFYKARWNKSISLLSVGKLKEGWENYESRLQLPEQVNDDRGFSQTRFQGECLNGKTILIYSEQGLGDEIMFANILSDIVKDAQHCIIECSHKLLQLYTRSFPTADIVQKTFPAHKRTQDPNINLLSPVGSLPRWFRGSLDCFPDHAGYLVVDKEKKQFWKRRLNALGEGIKVGICWRSMRQDASRNLHYTKILQWQQILQTPNIIFVNLQYDDCVGELAEVKKQYNIQIYSWEDLDLLDDLDGTAALTSALDLVISPSTSVAAMAGALGKPTWLLTPENDVGSLGTRHSPWFPNTRCFYKISDQDWSSVICQIANELSQQSDSELHSH